MEENSLIGVISISVILISALIYYFGVLWGHTQVADYTKADCYFAGVVFIIKYLLPACILILLIRDYHTFFNELSTQSISNFMTSQIYSSIGIGLFIICQLIFLEWINRNNKKYELRNKSEIYQEESVVLYFDVIKGILHWGEPPTDIRLFSRRKEKLKEHLYLLTISNMTIIFIYMFYSLGISKALILLSSGIAFLTFTNIVFSVGHSEAHYPKVQIYLKNNAIFEGNVLKFGDYMFFLIDGKTRLINKDDISYIEYI